jgi:hypothetical protein
MKSDAGRHQQDTIAQHFVNRIDGKSSGLTPV